MDVRVIAEAVRDAIPLAATRLRSDVRQATKAALASERSERARKVLTQIIRNDEMASEEFVPICQDTGTVWVWIELGTDECLQGDLHATVNEAVADAYREAALRMSVVRDALEDRSNTGDNTPAFIDISQRPGKGARVHVLLKGGGSDNSSAMAMLDPAEGEEGIERFVLDTVIEKATGACPPLLVGVGIGGTFDSVGKIAKRTFLRKVGSAAEGPKAAKLEERLLAAINATGIGPAGLGGDTTALAVHVATAPCHIAALPVAVNMGCCAVRSVSMDVA